MRLYSLLEAASAIAGARVNPYTKTLTKYEVNLYWVADEVDIASSASKVNPNPILICWWQWRNRTPSILPGSVGGSPFKFSVINNDENAL
jgi:hypothetical protein